MVLLPHHDTQDEDLVALNKPHGISTAPRSRHEGGTLFARAYGHLGTPPLVVHRLDMDTSGLVVFAKTKRAAAGLAMEFRQRRAQKEYLAICQGAHWASRVRARSGICRGGGMPWHLPRPVAGGAVSEPCCGCRCAYVESHERPGAFRRLTWTRRLGPTPRFRWGGVSRGTGTASRHRQGCACCRPRRPRAC